MNGVRKIVIMLIVHKGAMWMRGILPVWKERGMTSHDVVMKLRKLLKTKKIGHTGTLDPDVEGVLLICVGEATKLVELLMSGEKCYSGEITLGFDTETEDASGKIVTRTPVKTPVSTEKIDDTMQEMQGELIQIPPYYSAVKVNGKRLYEYARLGQSVERPKRKVTIMNFERTSEPIFDDELHTQKWNFDVVCSKGTYIRTLAVDLGKRLGYASHMSYLLRTATGGFTQEMALSLSEIEEKLKQRDIESILYPMEVALKDFPKIILTPELFAKVQHGAVLEQNALGISIVEPTVLMYNNKVKAIYNVHPTKHGLIKPMKMFVETVTQR